MLYVDYIEYSMYNVFITIFLFTVVSVAQAESPAMYRIRKGQTEEEVYKIMGAPHRETPLNICKGPTTKGFMWSYVLPSGRIKEVNVVYCSKRVDMIEYIHKY